MKNHYLAMVAIFMISSLWSADEAKSQTPGTWISCGSDGGNCNFGSEVNPTDVVTVRFGNEQDNSFFYTLVSGAVGSLPCSNMFGDPDYGKSKNCSYTTSSIIGNPPETGWNSFLLEGQNTVLHASQPLWIRFGANNNWYYAIYSGLPSENNTFSGVNIDCSINGVASGFDPYPQNQKTCEVVPALQPGGWTTCAIEGETCNMHGQGNAGVAVIAFGNAPSNGVINRFSLGTSIPCNITSFGADPSPYNLKECATYNLTTSQSVGGAGWNLQSSCNSGPNGCTLGSSITVGVSTTNMSEITQAWSATVTFSIKKKFEVGAFAGSTISAAAAIEFSNSTSFSTAVTQNASSTTSTGCSLDAGSNHFMQLWQFVTQSSFPVCDGNGSCVSTVNTSNIRCVIDPPPSYSGPQCIPTMCDPSDSACTTCTSDI